MQTKLTLRLDEKLIRGAKAHAKRKNTSLSQMVAAYFAIMAEDDPEENIVLAPLTESLKGALSGKEPLGKADYHQYLEEKYLK